MKLVWVMGEIVDDIQQQVIVRYLARFELVGVLFQRVQQRQNVTVLAVQGLYNANQGIALI